MRNYISYYVDKVLTAYRLGIVLSLSSGVQNFDSLSFTQGS